MAVTDSADSSDPSGNREILAEETAFQRDLLWTIAALDRPHGLAIKERLSQHYESEINHGRLYPNLDTLVERGLVEKGEVDRRTNCYTLTERGRRALQDRLAWVNERASEVGA